MKELRGLGGPAALALLGMVCYTDRAINPYSLAINVL